ncbi:MAG: 3-dehydroquinate synthase [Clostridiales bacterium]|nr:3-dehydroquinate synthase [Clostridiales bacterium]
MTNILHGLELTNEVMTALASCAFIVTDENVKRLYPSFTENAFVLSVGEKAKSPEILFSVLGEMNKRGLTRGDTVAAIGGGVTCDVTGLAAALYMRGIEWVSIPTTLLSMADAGIGGKTAVNFDGVKNLIGAFHAPSQTVISFEFTKTLSDREWLCGCGEIVKTCLLTEKSFDMLCDSVDSLKNRDESVVYKLVEKCIEIKNAVVTADPKEKGLRKILNVGHTVGHALESFDNYRLSHGEYIFKGMMAECAMCKDLIDEEYYVQLMRIFKAFTSPPKSSANAVYNYALKDKKNSNGFINIMLPASRGKVLNVMIEKADFISRYDNALKELKS